MSAMTDHKPSLPKVSSATLNRNANMQRSAANRTSSATRAAQKPTSTTHASLSAAHYAKHTNSTSRSRTRPAPVRSLSSPLGRSNSVRVSKKERRWSDRMGDPKSPTTYTDHFQDPLEMSDKLRSLNLETVSSRPSSSGSGGGGDTTYEQSFRWPRGRGSSSFRLFNLSSGEARDRGASNSEGTGGVKSSSATASAGIRDKPPSAGEEASAVSSARPVSRSNGVSGLSSNGSAMTAGASSSVPISKKNDRLQANGAKSFVSSSERKSSASSNESTSPAVKQSCNKDTKLTAQSANEMKLSAKPANGIGPMSQRTSPSYKTANGSAGSNIFSPASDSSTPRRNRAPQQKSSSPFVYGSDSGSWV